MKILITFAAMIFGTLSPNGFAGMRLSELYGTYTISAPMVPNADNPSTRVTLRNKNGINEIRVSEVERVSDKLLLSCSGEFIYFQRTGVLKSLLTCPGTEVQFEQFIHFGNFTKDELRTTNPPKEVFLQSSLSEYKIFTVPIKAWWMSPPDSF